jgi:hypothetical protein
MAYTPDELKGVAENPMNASAAIERRSAVSSRVGMQSSGGEDEKSGGSAAVRASSGSSGEDAKDTGAFAYTGGSCISFGGEDEKFLGHEASHTVQSAGEDAKDVGGFHRPGT